MFSINWDSDNYLNLRRSGRDAIIGSKYFATAEQAIDDRADLVSETLTSF